MKKTNDKKIGIVLVAILVFCLALYAINYYYENSIGEFKTEFALEYTHEEKLDVSGFAVRDEYRTQDGKVVSMLQKMDDVVYMPIISDGENVAKNGVVAIAFETQQQADNYLRVVELTEKIKSIEELKNNEGLDYRNVLFLNSQINAEVREYVRIINSCDVSELSTVSQDVAKNITAKQIAVGESIDFDSIIKDYEKEIKQLKATYSTDKTITSPFAGYFVSAVDGLEGVADYEKVADKEISNGSGAEFIAAKSEDISNIYGKIIFQHTWYYVFDVDISDASVLKTGDTVTVSFDDVGIDYLNMLVYDISDIKDEKITVTLTSTSMNEELATLRKEKASIVVNKYTGLRISNDAITKNEEGIVGVYVLYGDFVKFAPIDVKFYGDDYVIAEKLVIQEEIEVEGSEETQLVSKYYELKEYDRIIVKGINLEDGIIIS